MSKLRTFSMIDQKNSVVGDDSAHKSEILTIDKNNPPASILFLINNGMEQELTYQFEGAYIPEGETVNDTNFELFKVDIGAEGTVALSSLGYETLTDPFTHIRVTYSYAVAPTNTDDKLEIEALYR